MSQIWTGTVEDYYRLYDVAAKHLKSVFGDRIKVGAYASCGFYAIVSDRGAKNGKTAIVISNISGSEQELK